MAAALGSAPRDRPRTADERLGRRSPRWWEDPDELAENLTKLCNESPILGMLETKYLNLIETTLATLPLAMAILTSNDLPKGLASSHSPPVRRQ